jgi:predicted phage terminase large subunit-like protein
LKGWQQKIVLRSLARNNLFFLLRYICNRPDVDNDWLFARCNEVQAAPDGYLDLWSREHYKALALDTPVWTDGGWKKHGDLVPGDKVFSPDGRVVHVLANTGPMLGADCFRVGDVVAAGDHFWPHQRKIKTRIGDWREGRRVVSYETEKRSTRSGNIRLPHCAPLKGSADLPIDPYVFGAWLGDGHSGGNRITCAYTDRQIIDEVRAAGYEVREHKSSNQNTGLFIFGPGERGKRGTGASAVLREMGVINNKHVPKQYLLASPEDRLALLQGLMDTDGSCDTRGTAYFVQKGESLVDSVVFLARSLGMRASKSRAASGAWYGQFQTSEGACPFRLKRKADRCKQRERRMRTYRPEPIETVPVNCIQVEGGLYLAGESLLPTFNSTILTYAKTIQDILCTHGDDVPGVQPVTCGIFSHTRPIAKGFLRQIKREFEGNDLLREVFPDVVWENPQRDAPKWSEDDGIILRRATNPKEATVEAWGLVDGMPTGKHFSLMVFDDVVVPGSVTTPDMIEKTTSAFQLADNLGARGGAKRVIGTRYHFNDTYRSIMESGTAIPRVYPATVDGTPDGEPVLLTREEIAAKRRVQGPYIFACQMLQDPAADESQGFKREWIRYYDEVSPGGLNKYILVDPANGKRKHNDYTAMWCLGLGKDQNIYVLDILRDRLNLTERARVLMEWHRKWQPQRRHGVRYEKVGMQADIDHIKDVQAKENYRFEIEPVGGTTAKNDRIKRLIPYFEQGRFYFPRTWHYTDYEGVVRDLVRDFVEQEYTAFPVPVHDDMLDALARIAEPDLDLIWPKGREKGRKDYGFEESPGKEHWMNW